MERLPEPNRVGSLEGVAAQPSKEIIGEPRRISGRRLDTCQGHHVLRYQVQSPLSDADGEGSALPSAMEVIPYLSGASRKLLEPLARAPRTYPSRSPWFPDLQQRLRAPPGPGPAPGRGFAVTWGAGALPPGHPAAAFTFWRLQYRDSRRPPARALPRYPSSSLSLRAPELRHPGAT